MQVGGIGNQVNALEESIKTELAEAADADDGLQIKKQLKAIDRSVRSLERESVPVPREIQDLRESLKRQLSKFQGQGSDLIKAYERLLELNATLARATGRNLRKDATLLMRQSRPRPIDSAELLKATLVALGQLGGSARRDEVERAVEDLVSDKLSEFDRDDSNNKHQARWLSRLYRARNQLVREGKLSIGKGKNPIWRVTR
jgi:hypothetical protein